MKSGMTRRFAASVHARASRLREWASAAATRRDAGTVSVIFAMCAGLMIATMALALGAIQGAMADARFRDADDIATLSGGADASRYATVLGADLAQWQADVQAYVQANLPAGTTNINMPESNITATMTDAPNGGRAVSVTIKGTLDFIVPVIMPTGSGDGSGSGSGSGNQALPSTEPISATASAIFVPKQTVEVVMVLDNTGSMADRASSSSNASKMDGLQAAANMMVSQLFSAGSGDTYVGIVPFRTTVNVAGALPANGTWLKPSFSYNPNGVSMSSSDSTHPGWGGCAVEPRDSSNNLSPEAYSPADSRKFTPYYYNVPSTGLAVRQFGGNCKSSTTTTTYTGMPFPATLSGGTINACGVTPAGTNVGATYDKDPGSTTASSGSWNPDQNADCISTPVTFLTQDTSKLTAAIKAMNPSGSTIIPTGLLWGWRMLSSPWSQATAPGSGWISSDVTLPRPETTLGLQRVMVVLTDGENQVGNAGYLPNDLYFNGLSGVGTNNLSAPTVARTDSSGTLSNGTMESSENYALPTSGTGNSSDINSFQVAVCTAIKNSGVTIYAFTFGSVSTTAANTMTACASPGDYKNAPTNQDLATDFAQIAQNLGILRLTQ